MTGFATCACGCGSKVQRTGSRGPVPRYASQACRMRAMRNRRVAEFVFESVNPERVANQVAVDRLPVSGLSTDQQVQQGLLEARAVTFAMQRLGRTARPDLAWRCARLGEAMEQALKDSFGGIGL